MSAVWSMLERVAGLPLSLVPSVSMNGVSPGARSLEMKINAWQHCTGVLVTILFWFQWVWQPRSQALSPQGGKAYPSNLSCDLEIDYFWEWVAAWGARSDCISASMSLNWLESRKKIQRNLFRVFGLIVGSSTKTARAPQKRRGRGGITSRASPLVFRSPFLALRPN